MCMEGKPQRPNDTLNEKVKERWERERERENIQGVNKIHSMFAYT